VVSVVDAITPARRADSDRGRAQQPGDQGDRRRRAQLEKAADAEKEGQPGGWRRYGGPRAEHGNPATMWDRRRQRDWKGPRMRRRIWHGGHGRMARRQGPASTGSAMGYGVDRDGAFQPIRSGPGQLPGRVQDAARTPYLGRGCAQDGIGGAAEARTGGDGVHPSRGTEIRALTKPDALLAGAAGPGHMDGGPGTRARWPGGQCQET